MNGSDPVRRRIAVRDAVAARIRVITAAALTVSAVLSGLFAGIAAASAPGHNLSSETTPRSAAHTGRVAGSSSTSNSIPPLPAAPGPGGASAAGPPAPTPAPAPAVTQTPPVVVSGGS